VTINDPAVHPQLSLILVVSPHSRRPLTGRRYDDQFYADILKFVAGEPNGITTGTIGETQALIARRLVAEEPGLTAPGRRAELMEKISSIYDRDHAVRVTFLDAEIALAAVTAQKRVKVGTKFE
jgi:hypothetical protein